MIFFLYGPDTYRAKQKFNEIISQYRDSHKSGLNFRSFDVENDSFEDFKNTANSVSMFGEKKLIALKNAFVSKDFTDAFLLWDGKEDLTASNDIICLFADGVLKKTESMFKWLKENAKTQEFKELKGPALKSWAVNYGREKGVSLDELMAGKVILHTGANLYALSNEISKIASYVLARQEERVVTKNDLDVFIRPRLETNIFALVDCFIERDGKKALRLLQGHVEAGDDERRIFSTIQAQFRNIAQVKDLTERGERDSYKISKMLNVHPFVAKKSLWQSAKIEKEEVKNIYKILVDMDRKIKTGEISPRSALERLLLR